MKDSEFELNKIAGAIILAGLIAMLVGTVGRALYHRADEGKRGYQIEIAEEGDGETGAGDAASAEAAAEVNLSELMAVADAVAGEKLGKKCVACHTFEEGGPNKVGPNLWGIIGEAVAHRDDFNYSQAMVDYSGQASGWDYDNLFHFLSNPKKFIKGTKMAFVGLKKPSDVADMLAYLRQMNSNPPPLP